jgi:glycosyltransferase involved in cell wall biosynthesis
MTKILFISNQYTPNVVGGAELITQATAEELARRGHEVVVASVAPDGRASQDVVNGVRVYRVPVANLYAPFTDEHGGVQRALWHVADSYNPWMARRIGRILDLEKPDWMCPNNIAGFSVSVWGEAQRRGIRTMQVLHDYYAICPRSTMLNHGSNCERPCLTCRAYGFPRKLASSQPDIVVGVSKFVLQRHLDEGYFRGVRTAVVYTVGFIGRVEEPKGIEVLLKALGRLPHERWRLRVAGRATHPEFLDYLKRTYPYQGVEYLGYTNADAFYRSVDVVVVPSTWHEPLPGVVYEPFGYGIPVIASRMGGIPEIVGDAGCGWLFEAGNVDELAGRLSKAIDGWDDPHALSERALARRRFFTPERQADELSALLA